MHFNSLLSKVTQDHPQYTFLPSKEFRWSHTTKTIYYNPSAKYAAELLIHELAHAHLHHADFSLDVILINKEAAAWQYARDTLASQYSFSISDTVINHSLDSYRDWLHARSSCPECHNNALQAKNGTYKCIACKCHWRANAATHCELKRYRINSLHSVN